MRMSYGQRAEMIATHAWETWTKNGLGLDSNQLFATVQAVNDAVADAWTDGISDIAWLDATLKRLGEVRS
jgi:hypothetical protein